ncbi:MAG: hypothetical protein COA66_03835 [Arcobacter sp.]|nr:MAG: hypothetical protein COA66_03835 [Arcobacter sp.]
MQDIPLELITSFLSIIGLIMIFRQYFGYKKVIEVVKDLGKIKENNKLSQENKTYITNNLKEYQDKLTYQIALNKLLYPVFIIIGAAFTMLVPFDQAIIHFNVLFVGFIYISIIKIHLGNIVKFLEELNE